MFERLKSARARKKMKMRELAAILGVDQSLISKFESGDRLPTESQVTQLAEVLEIPDHELKVLWLKEKILSEVRYKPYASEALSMVSDIISEYNAASFSNNYEIQELLEEIDTLKQSLDLIRSQESFRIREALELEYTFESNRIEGNTLTLQETDLVINEGLTIAGKSLREHLEAINHKDAISYMKDLVQGQFYFNERELLSIHNLILRGIYPNEAGKYRTVQVMISGSTHIPPQALHVQSEMDNYFHWYSKNKTQLHPVVLAAEMHEKLVTIHPFIDGNGRTSRMVMNAILLQHGYVIANIKGDATSRMNYYKALDAVQTEKSKDAFIAFVAQVEKESLQRYLSIVG